MEPNTRSHTFVRANCLSVHQGLHVPPVEGKATRDSMPSQSFDCGSNALIQSAHMLYGRLIRCCPKRSYAHPAFAANMLVFLQQKLKFSLMYSFVNSVNYL